MLYSDKYLKGKHGVILVVDGSSFSVCSRESAASDGQASKDPYQRLEEKIKIINQNTASPLSLIVNKFDILDEM